MKTEIYKEGFVEKLKSILTMDGFGYANETSADKIIKRDIIRTIDKLSKEYKINNHIEPEGDSNYVGNQQDTSGFDNQDFYAPKEVKRIIDTSDNVCENCGLKESQHSQVRKHCPFKLNEKFKQKTDDVCEKLIKEVEEECKEDKKMIKGLFK